MNTRWMKLGTVALAAALTACANLAPSYERPAAPAALRAPLVFRRWTPETKMVRGDWNIPVPPPDAEVVTPDIALAPGLMTRSRSAARRLPHSAAARW